MTNTNSNKTAARDAGQNKATMGSLNMAPWSDQAGRGYAFGSDGETPTTPELAKLDEATLDVVAGIAKESYLTGFARAVYLMASGLGLDPQTVSDKMRAAYVRCNRASGRKQWEPCFREALGL